MWIRGNKYMWFVEHIEEHLKDMAEVKDKRAYCKICDTDIDTIAERKTDEIMKALEKAKVI